MSRSASTIFICTQCAHPHHKWGGQCERCHSWNTLEASTAKRSGSLGKARKMQPMRTKDFTPLANATDIAGVPARCRTDNSEFDRVCGGGLVAGEVLLLGGDPGIGKSTLLLQIAADIGKQGIPSLYVSGEESHQQIHLRAQRLKLANAKVDLANVTHVDDLLASCEQKDHAYRLIIIDSIQTMWTEQIDSAPGTVTQLRASTQLLIDYAKTNYSIVLLVGHVTKDGQIAGPRVLEHMVDAVIYFEGDTSSGFRLLRSVKNRFGPANEIGVFEMTAQGLLPVSNPSEVFLRGRETQQAGTMVFAGLEGTRPILVEIQVLLAPSSLAAPRRTAQGWDGARLSMLLAVLETRLGVMFGKLDVFLNIAGGLRVQDPAADLAVAAALLSALNKTPCPPDSVAFGEISLAGSIRPAGQTAARLREAARLGFAKAFCAPVTKPADLADFKKILPLDMLAHLQDLRHSLTQTGSAHPCD